MAKDRTRHKRRVSRSRSQAKPDRPTRDYHHILYQRRHWLQPWAKKLREHPYTGGYIPTDTLHRKIHETIHDIPCPNEDVCELIWRDLEDLRLMGIIDENDNIQQKLNVLIELIPHCGSNLDATLAMLKWQLQVVQKLYKASQ